MTNVSPSSMTMRPLDTRAPRACDVGLAGCNVCGVASPFNGAVVVHCSRCGATLHSRKVASLKRTWAFFIAALILYIPANLLPVMATSMLGSSAESTILGGVVGFLQDGSWDIALLIFVASIVVPVTKFFVLGLLLYTSQRGSVWANRHRGRLYRLVELIGYWSILDVAVVGLVSALLRFKTLANAEPGLGIIFFGCVVVLTILAAQSFDPRLIWDGKVNSEHSR